MKKKLFVIIISIAISSFITLSQGQIQSSAAHVATGKNLPSWLSNNAKLFIDALSQEVAICSITPDWIPTENLIEQFPIGIMRDSVFTISGFLEVQKDFDLEQLKSLGVLFQIDYDPPFSSAFIPLTSLCKFLQLKGIVRFELVRKAIPLLDVARPAVNAQNLIVPPGNETAYTGKGVLIGIVDFGFDYGHPDFYNKDGTKYRINKVWEQKSQNGNPPQGFSYGTELSDSASIVNAGTDTEFITHGTHVAGIAAGSGAGTEYYGLAPDAEIILVSTTRDDVGISDGLQYIINNAQSQNKPCVINFSLGSNIGPHDGTSAFDRLCDQKVAPGLLFTGAAGNDGFHPLYFSNQFESGSGDSIVETAIIPFENASGVILDLWGSVGSEFGVSVGYIDTLNNNSVFYQSPFMYTSDATHNVKTYPVNLPNSTLNIIQLAAETSPYNNRPSIMLQYNFNEKPEGYIPLIKVVCQNGGLVEGWTTDGIISDLDMPDQYINGSTTHTVNEIGGTGKSMLTAGAVCTKTNWTSTDGSGYHYAPCAVLGQIANFSSLGPTSDGRIKPDITCPGYGVVSAFSRFLDAQYPPQYYRVTSVPFNGNQYYFGILQGTSTSAPILAGTIALWLEEFPNLTIDEVKQIFNSTSLPAPSGTLPNNTWGYGILNAQGGMNYLKQSESTATTTK